VRAPDDLVEEALAAIELARPYATVAGRQYLEHARDQLQAINQRKPAQRGTRHRLLIAIATLADAGKKTRLEGMRHVTAAIALLEDLADIWGIDPTD
jgi:hypothetical protein